MKIKQLILCCVFLLLTAVCASATEHEFTIKVADENVEFIAVSVLNPYVTSFESVTPQNIGDVVFDAETFYVTPGVSEYTYKLLTDETDPNGKYTVRITYTNTDRAKTVSEYRYFEKLTKAATDTILEEIGDASNVSSELKKYSDENKLILPMDKIQATADFNTVFANVKEEQYKEGFKSVDDLYAAVDTVFFIKEFATSASDGLEKYLTDNENIVSDELAVYNSLTEEQQSFAEKIYNTEKTAGAESLNDIKTILDRSLGMSIIKYGTYSEKAEAFETYAKDFGFDVEKAKANNVSLAEIAQLISGDSVSDIKTSFADTLAMLIKGDSGSSSGGGGGGGGSSKVSGSTSFAPVINTPPTESQKPASSIFSDMDTAVWAIGYVEDLYAKGVVSGDGDGKFRPGSNITRAEFVKMVVSAFGYTMTGADKEFSDSNKNNWYYPYIVTAYNNSIVTGKSEDYFGANENITRQDMAVILYRVLKLAPEKGEITFSDKADVSEYAADAVKTLAAKGILNGFEDGTFGAKKFASRAEAAALISRSIAY